MTAHPKSVDPADRKTIAALTYEPGTRWAAEPRSIAQGSLLLLSHALRGREDPQRVMPIVGAAARDAIVLEGPRGEAPQAAAALMELMREHFGGRSGAGVRAGGRARAGRPPARLGGES